MHNNSESLLFGDTKKVVAVRAGLNGTSGAHQASLRVGDAAK